MFQISGFYVVRILASEIIRHTNQRNTAAVKRNLVSHLSLKKPSRTIRLHQLQEICDEELKLVINKYNLMKKGYQYGSEKKTYNVFIC